MKHPTENMRSVRGSAALTIIIAVLVLAAIAGGAWWYLNRDKGAEIPAPVTATTAPTIEDSEPAPPVVSAAVEGLSIDQLYREARKAMAEQRLVAPVGNNALEFYLAILEKDPTNTGANDALRELFPFASGTAEQEINQGNLEEATRIIDSLAKADPSNYTLTILRNKIDAKKKQEEQLQVQAAAAADAAAATTATAAAASQSEREAATAAAAEAAAATAAAKAPKPAPTPVPVAPPPTPAAPQGETRDVEVITPIAPSYPTQAARNREEGWVEVEFTVTADGKVQNASVTASVPPRIFDREAVRSIERTKFSPRLENGQAVSSTVRRRIEFKLGG